MLNKSTFIIALAVLLFAFAKSDAQVLRRHYTMKKILPHGLISAIEPAGRYVWFGGWDMRPGEDHGIARFDKQTGEWRLFIESEGVIADEINSLTVDGEYLWIGTNSDWPWNRGMYRYHPATQTSRRYDRTDGLPHWRVRDVAVHGDEVWAATMGGAARYDRENDTWKGFTRRDGHLQDDFMMCIEIDDDNVWVGSYAGLEIYDRRRNTWRNLNSRNSIFETGVTKIAQDEGRIWFLCPPRVIVYNRETQQFSNWSIHHQPARESSINNIAVTSDKVFFGSDKGLHEWDKQTNQWRTYTQRDGLLLDNVTALGADDDFVWCVDNQGLGMSRLNRRSGRWEHLHYREGSMSNHIYSFLAEGDRLYVGTFGAGLWEYNVRDDRWINRNLLLKSDGQFYHYRGEKSPVKFSDIRQMVSKDGRIWLATNHGLCMHDPATEEDLEVFSFESFPLLSLAVHKDILLCGSQRRGLWTFNTDTSEWDNVGERIGLTRRINAIQVVDGLAYVTDGDIVYRFNPDTEELQRIEGDYGDGILSLLVRKNRLWIGTDHGLWIHNIETGETREISEEHLPSTVIHTIEHTRGMYWIGTEEGLAGCEDPDDYWVTFTQDDILTANIVTAVAGDRRFLWVGTMGGGFSRLMNVGFWEEDGW